MTGRKTLLMVGIVTVLAVCLVAPAREKVLYQKPSPYNTIVVTEDDEGLRTLYFERNGVRQSVVKVGDPDHIELAYARVMPVGLAVVQRPQRVLIVGLGGGTIPSFLHKHYPEMTIDVVDIDPDVVDVAKRFFGFREDATLKAHVADGREFIERCRTPYDVVFLDAFGPDSIPYHLATCEFLRAVRRVLRPGGVAVGNVWSRGSNPLYDSMLRTYQEVFDEVYVVDVVGAGNKIILALPRHGPIRREALARRAARISREKQFPFDLGAAVASGFRSSSQERRGGRVLRDADSRQVGPPPGR